VSLIERKRERKSACQSVEQRYYELRIATFATCDANFSFVVTWVSSFQDKARKATGMQIDATGDDYGDPDLFSISVIKVSWCFSSHVLCYVSLVAFFWDLILVARWKTILHDIVTSPLKDKTKILMLLWSYFSALHAAAFIFVKPQQES
jgi:hypothetical protein